MPRIFLPQNIKAHVVATRFVSAVDDSAYVSFGLGDDDPAPDHELKLLAGTDANASPSAAMLLGVTWATVKNYSAHVIYATFSDPAINGADADDTRAVAVPAHESIELDLAGTGTARKVWVKGATGGADVGVTVGYTEVAQ